MLWAVCNTINVMTGTCLRESVSFGKGNFPNSAHQCGQGSLVGLWECWDFGTFHHFYLLRASDACHEQNVCTAKGRGLKFLLCIVLLWCGIFDHHFYMYALEFAQIWLHFTNPVSKINFSWVKMKKKNIWIKSNVYLT